MERVRIKRHEDGLDIIWKRRRGWFGALFFILGVSALMFATLYPVLKGEPEALWGVVFWGGVVAVFLVVILKHRRIRLDASRGVLRKETRILFRIWKADHDLADFESVCIDLKEPWRMGYIFSEPDYYSVRVRGVAGDVEVARALRRRSARKIAALVREFLDGSAE